MSKILMIIMNKCKSTAKEIANSKLMVNRMKNSKLQAWSSKLGIKLRI